MIKSGIKRLKVSRVPTHFNCENLIDKGIIYSTENDSIVVSFILTDVDRTELAMKGVAKIVEEFKKEYANDK